MTKEQDRIAILETTIANLHMRIEDLQSTNAIQLHNYHIRTIECRLAISLTNKYDEGGCFSLEEFEEMVDEFYKARF